MTDGGGAPPRTVVVGCGHWGRNLVRNVYALGALAAVSDVDPATAGEMAETYGVPALAPVEAFADPAIEAAVIATPAERHFAVAREALAAGKHVFVEKPIALASADGAVLARMADERGLTLMVGHLLQYHPAVLALRRLVADGALGRLRYVYSNRLSLGRFRREENVFWSFAPHDVSVILSLVGEEPSAVRTTGHAFLHRTIADVTTMHLEFPGGVAAHIFVSWLHPFKEQKLVVVGETGMAVFDDVADWPAKLVVHRHGVSWREGQPIPVRGDAEPVPLEPAEPLAEEVSHFLDCVATRRRPRTDGEEALRVLRVLESGERFAFDGPGEPPAPPPAAKPEHFAHETAVVDEGAEVGVGTRIWHFSHILPATRIGRGCTLGQNVMAGPRVVIGDGCRIQNNVSLYEGVTLEDDVFCGPSAVFTNVLTPRAHVSRKDEFAPTLVKRGATIGANATVLCGTTLGRYCFVAAGAVVTRDVPDFALVQGMPARQVGWVSHAGEVLGDDLVCPRQGRRYRLADGGERLEEIP